MQDYETYQAKFAAKLQAEHNQKFTGQFATFRTLLELVHSHE